MGSKLRRWRWWFAVFVGMLAVTLTSSSPEVKQQQQQQTVSRIAFGSCNNQSAPQPIWDAVVDFHPQVFIWLGDNIYGDTKHPFKLFGRERTIGPWKNVPRFVPSSEQEMEAKYKRAKSHPVYTRLRQNAKVVGTWDDHDYGLNNAGKEFDRKVTNQKLLLDFLDEPQDSPRRKQAGVYASYTYGSAGRDVKIILLDARYHRDPVGSCGTMLGDSQWSWFEKELKGPQTAITIIGSSVQVIPNHTAITLPFFDMESWTRFPKERDRLFKLIADSKRSGVFFISGDVHFGEISRYDCGGDYPLYEVTSSGITQSVEGTLPDFFHYVVRFVAWLVPSTMRVKNKNCRYKSCIYGQPNFGAIEINWESQPVTLKLEIRDKNGHPVSGINTSLRELQASNSQTCVTEKAAGCNCTPESSLPWIVRYRIAILVFVSLALLLLALVLLLYAVIKFVRQGICSKRKPD
ncbi:hypothetical protein PIB30_022508 [Stylosanthes scabra]|uniref:PhoD-like phosphatase metallophosphatase domain-containing protein n=1 Tax=Stylosanthes scabra TaxID=79078 RepID=A0ABU6V7B2_9FABA|nr:hypothetical protein [Stylosanthes scabra]